MSYEDIIEVIKGIQLDIAELNQKIENLQNQINDLESEDTGGVILDGCNEAVQRYINQDNKKDGDK